MHGGFSSVVRSFLVAAGCAALLVVLNGPSARAQAPGATATSLPPSWYGVWAGAGSPQGFPPPENTKSQLEGGGNYEQAYIYQNLRDWARQRYHETDWNLDDFGQRCQLMGIFRQGLGGGATFRFMESGSSNKFYRTSGTYEETGLHTIRFGEKRPINFRPVYQGDFRAHWEGETLVIESQGYNDKTWILTDRWPHTESFRVIERYRLVGDGTYLELRVFLDDHRAFRNPMTFTRYYRKSPDPVQSTENICNPQEEGDNLWWERYKNSRDEHNAMLEEFMKKTLEENPKAPAYSGPAIMGPAGGGRGGGGRGGGRAGGAPAGAPAGRGGGPAGAQGGGRGAAAPAAVPAPNVPAMSAEDGAKLRRLGGVWRLTDFNATLPNGLRNQGTLLDIPLTAAGQAAQKEHDVANDPGKYCQSIGPFRMLARPGNALELSPTSRGAIMLFENTSVGNKRDIIFNRDHLPNFEPNWHGDSIGRFEGDTLVVSTRGFNTRTWLNDAAAQHTTNLRLTERYRLVPNTELLEVQVTAEDPEFLERPYTYTRYYQRGPDFEEIQCWADIIQ